MRNTQGISVGNPDWEKCLGDLRSDGKIILCLILDVLSLRAKISLI